ncbi:MAG TPA: hypothetical protein VD905_00410 [Flavobacteriales bacterium]|nr:hypothetical protein [Flavobacteriales bacterium]
MKTLLTSLLALYLIYANGQNPLNTAFVKKPDGPYRENYANGKPMWEYTKKNGNLEGKYHTYFKNGIIDSEFTFDNGKFHGKCFRLNEKGDTISLDISRHDTLVYYKQNEFYKNGRIKNSYSALFTDSLKPNTYPRAKVLKLIGYFNYDIIKILSERPNTMHCVTYYESGAVKLKGVRLKNKLEGIWTEYYENGKVLNVSQYKNDKLEGESITYDENGNMKYRELYRNNKKVDNLPLK